MRRETAISRTFANIASPSHVVPSIVAVSAEIRIVKISKPYMRRIVTGANSRANRALRLGYAGCPSTEGFNWLALAVAAPAFVQIRALESAPATRVSANWNCDAAEVGSHFEKVDRLQYT